MTRFIDALSPWDGPRSGEGRRARLLILFALAQIAVSTALLLAYTVMDATPAMVGISLVAVGAALCSLLALRLTGSTRIAAGLMFGYVASITFCAGLSEAGRELTWSPWWAALPLLGAATTGRRFGVIMAGVSLTAIAALFAVHQTGNAIATDAFPANRYVASTLGHNAATGLVWAFAWMHDRSRDGAVADLHHAMARLRDSDAHRTALFDHSPAMVCALDTNLAITHANEQMRATWRRLFDVDIVLGTRLIDLLPSEATTQARWSERLERVREGERIEAIEAIDTLVGRRFLDACLAPVHARGQDGGTGEVLGVALYASDVTERLESDARLQRTNAQLVTLSRRAGQAEVATGILHDLGNTLNGVSVSADHLSERLRRLRLDRVEALAERIGQPEVSNEMVQRYVRALAHDLAMQRATLLDGVDTLLSDVVQVRSLVTSQRRYTEGNALLGRTNLREVTEQALAWHRIALARGGVEVTTRLDALPDVRVDRSLVLQLLDGLIANAQLSFDCGLPTRPRLAMEGSSDDGVCRLSVSDNGLALPERVESGTRPSDDPRWARLQACAELARELGGNLVSARTTSANRFTLQLPAETAGVAHAPLQPAPPEV